jgi:hypothetical protein
VQAVPNSREAAAVGSDARVAQPPAVPGVLAQRPVAAGEAALDAEAVPQRAAVPREEQVPQQAAEVSDAEAVLLQVAVSGAEAAPLQEEVSGAEVAPRQVAVSVLPAALQREADPSAAPWAFRRDRCLPWPVRRRAVRSARAMFVSQAASPSERSWQAARCEGLS